MERDRIRSCLTRHPDWTDRRISKALKVPLAAVAAARPGRCAKHPAYQAVRPPCAPCPACQALWDAKHGGNGVQAAASKRGKTLQYFKAQFDVRERIRAGLRAHLNGVYMTDQEFREACGVLAQDWRRFADLEEFEAYRWRYKGMLYWAQPKLLAAMKEAVGVV